MEVWCRCGTGLLWVLRYVLLSAESKYPQGANPMKILKELFRFKQEEMEKEGLGDDIRGFPKIRKLGDMAVGEISWHS